MKSNKINPQEEKLYKLLCSLFANPEREYKFDRVGRINDKGKFKLRVWRFDFAYPDKRVAVECEGGIWTGGRHINPQGFMQDLEKYNSAASQGWTVFRLTPNMIEEDYVSSLLMPIMLMGNNP